MPRNFRSSRCNSANNAPLSADTTDSLKMPEPRAGMRVFRSTGRPRCRKQRGTSSRAEVCRAAVWPSAAAAPSPPAASVPLPVRMPPAPAAPSACIRRMGDRPASLVARPGTRACTALRRSCGRKRPSPSRPRPAWPGPVPVSAVSLKLHCLRTTDRAGVGRVVSLDRLRRRYGRRGLPGAKSNRCRPFRAPGSRRNTFRSLRSTPERRS
jgi:hypothetical protein